MGKALPLRRLITYKPSFHSYIRPKSLVDSRYGHNHVDVNKQFWLEVHERGDEVMAALRTVDTEGER